ncbi:ExbD/TolR family protein [Cupriavidus necator]
MSIMTDPSGGDELLNDINMTPLIDVMLVLLIIFIVTLPVMNQAVKVTLPKAAAQPADSKPKDIDLSITASGAVLWNRQPVNADELTARIVEAAGAQDAPAVSIYADAQVPYERVAKVLASVQGGGLSKINFVTDPVKDGK